MATQTWISTYTFVTTIGDPESPDDGGDLTFALDNRSVFGGDMEGIISFAVTAVSAVRITEATGAGGADDGASAADSVQSRPSSQSRLYRNHAGVSP